MNPIDHLMRRVTAILMVLLAGTIPCAASEPASAPVDENALLGTWIVDLRPTPGAEPYYQELVVTSIQGKAFTGTFYGSEISQARLNTDWGTLRIAFVTKDGSGPYHHSAVLNGHRLEGLSNATGRGFLSYWSAEKREQ